MPITINQLLTWCGVPAVRRAAVMTELMPDGLTDLNLFSTEELLTAIKGFKDNLIDAEKFKLTASSSKKIIQLALWVKDKTRLNQAVEFNNQTTPAIFNREIGAAQDREAIRKARVKSGENLTTLKIDPPLKTSGGWDSWSDAIKAALGLSYGARGVPLLYIIRDEEPPDELFDEDDEEKTWEDEAVLNSPHLGDDYLSDKKTVHLFLLNNISEDSDAYAYIQPYITKNDGRKDWLSLQGRYESPAHIQAKVAEANQLWDKLYYRNERAMTFEVFSRKLTKIIQIFKRAGRFKHEVDIVEWLWIHIECPEMKHIIGGLKATHNLTDPPRSYHDILGALAKEIPNLTRATTFTRSVQEINTNIPFTFDGSPPESGGLNSAGQLFCGGYTNDHWRSDEMRDHRKAIIELRKKHNYKGGNRKGGKKQAVQRARRKLQQVKQKVKNESRKLAALKAKKDKEERDGEEISTALVTVNNQAGDAFGGRAAMGGRG